MDLLSLLVALGYPIGLRVLPMESTNAEPKGTNGLYVLKKIDQILVMRIGRRDQGPLVFRNPGKPGEVLLIIGDLHLNLYPRNSPILACAEPEAMPAAIKLDLAFNRAIAIERPFESGTLPVVSERPPGLPGLYKSELPLRANGSADQRRPRNKRSLCSGGPLQPLAAEGGTVK